MKSRVDPAIVVILGYLLGILITFGHAYKSIPDTETGYFGGEPYTMHNGVGTKVTGSFLSSIAWPLYWSVQVWR
jgi:hypothetical protein